MKTLWIGNSYTQRNDLPALVAELAAENGEILEHERVMANGASLRLHWNKGDALSLIERGNWDFVVLQEQSTLPLKNAARFHDNVRLFDNAIKKNGVQTVLYQTWSRQNAPETQDALSAAIEEIAAEIAARVAPVGTVWHQVLKTGADLYDKDGSHPSPLGSRLAARVFYATLFGRDVKEVATKSGFKVL